MLDAERRCTAAEERAAAAEKFARHMHLAGSELARVYEENDVLRSCVEQAEEDIKSASAVGSANSKQKVQYL